MTKLLSEQEVATYRDRDMIKISRAIGEVLRSVPLGKEARSKELGEANGNAALGGYDCVIVSGPSPPYALVVETGIIS